MKKSAKYSFGRQVDGDVLHVGDQASDSRFAEGNTDGASSSQRSDDYWHTGACVGFDYQLEVSKVTSL